MRPSVHLVHVACLPEVFEHFNSLSYLYKTLNKSTLLSVDMSEIAGRLSNSVDSDQPPQNAASDLGLHRLLKSVCPNTKGKYDF